MIRKSRLEYILFAFLPHSQDIQGRNECDRNAFSCVELSAGVFRRGSETLNAGIWAELQPWSNCTEIDSGR